MHYHPLVIGENGFADAPVSERYPETIYYRLLAHQYLSDDVDKILYLDADILCLNSIQALYDIDLKGYLYAAASHEQVSKLAVKINQVRLNTTESESYYNTGVLLMNVNEIRQVVNKETIFDFIKNNRHKLILPDQDVLNALYGGRVYLVADENYNYDSRYSPFVFASQRRQVEWKLDYSKHGVFTFLWER